MASMRAVVLDRFGGPEELKLQTVPVPEVGAGEVLIRVHTAGVGEWDPLERQGVFVELSGRAPSFPYVLGSDGSGTVEAVGEGVTNVAPGDEAYAAGFLNPKGGFYAEYAVVKAQDTSKLPKGLSLEAAGAMPAIAITALQGVDDTLKLKPGETVAVVGASGGVGHLAVQLAKRMGARVLAVASGEDGVDLARRLGADAVVDGRRGDVEAAARAFAPEGLDAALFLAGGDVAQKVMAAVRDGGRTAYPSGVQPEPEARSGVALLNFDGVAGADVISRLNRLIEAGPFEVHIAQTFPWERAADAHRALEPHFLGKLTLRVA